jgi:long-chain fatty acid transport protein
MDAVVSPRAAPRPRGVAARPAFLAGAALAIVASTESPARANEPGMYGFGSRPSAMAGAATADAADFTGGYYNPAALASARGTELAFGYTYNDNQLRVDGEDTGVDSVHGVVLGIVAPGRLFGVPFAFGVSSHIPDDGLSRLTALRQDVPRWELYDHRAALLYLAANLAVRPVEWLELGGGIGFLAATQAQLDVRGRADVISPRDSQLQHQIDGDLTSVRYPLAGVRFLLAGWGALGVTYRGESGLDLDVGADLSGNVNFAGIDVPVHYLLESMTIDAFNPRELAFGVSLQRIPNLTVNVDLVYVNWASYESPTALTTASLDARPPPGTPVDLPDDVRPVEVLPPEFEDRLVPHVGAEYVVPVAGPPREVKGDLGPHRLFEIPLRLGYAYEASPVPPQTGLTNFVDADRHIFSAGTGALLHAPVEELPASIHLDVHAQLSVLPKRETEKTNPSDFIGSYTADGTIIGLGTTLRAVF